MPLTLSLNTNPLVNRFADPYDLIDTVARDLRLRDLQLTHEFINPGWPAAVIRRLTRQMSAALARTGVRVTSGMTGPYGRLNHFGHPDRDGIPPEQPLVQQLDRGPFDKAQLQQPALQLGLGQAGGMRPAHIERDNAATEAHGGFAQC